MVIRELLSIVGSSPLEKLRENPITIRPFFELKMNCSMNHNKEYRALEESKMSSSTQTESMRGWTIGIYQFSTEKNISRKSVVKMGPKKLRDVND